MKEEANSLTYKTKMKKEIQLRLEDEMWGARIAKNVFELNLNSRKNTLSTVKTNFANIIPLSAAALFIAAITIAGFTLQNKLNNNETKETIAKKEQRTEQRRNTPTFRGRTIHDNLDNIIEASLQMR